MLPAGQTPEAPEGTRCSSLMHFYAGPPMHFLSGVDTSPVPPFVAAATQRSRQLLLQHRLNEAADATAARKRRALVVESQTETTSPHFQPHPGRHCCRMSLPFHS